MTPFVVGAYASLPEAKMQPDYYRLLASQDWISGIEIPYPGDVAEHATWLCRQISPNWDFNTITAIPGTMQNMGGDPLFGLASPDDDGRVAALQFVKRIAEGVKQMSDLSGRSLIRKVQLHSAPTKVANKEALESSLEDILQLDWFGAEIVVEHCDRYIPGQTPEKGFLQLSDEIEVCNKLGLKIHINWGRSVVEGRDARLALEHINECVHSGVLAGVFFSGAGPYDTQYGYSWIDGHLPAACDEPASLLSAEAINECSQAAIGGGAEYVGAKICVPVQSTLSTRLNMIKHIYESTSKEEKK
ncbi:DUF4862 family protein [Propionimicrobium lymphophilum]|uniref:DUF4862 family protein n=1 Tax=Propionimicrobium lymphophilum TaxID=33012 RepID=UPI00288BEBA2|nr:DUF4862 family protein [Propionimicrobium lymphophilum]